MRNFSLDTNCMIAAVCSWHEHHDAAVDAIESRLQQGHRLAVPAPALVEMYAVLTRLPSPHRLSPADAWMLIEANFVESAFVIAPSAAAYRTTLRQAAAAGIAGGRTYDAVIGECARQGKADTLLTFNRRHFDPLPAGVAVIDPSTLD